MTQFFDYLLSFEALVQFGIVVVAIIFAIIFSRFFRAIIIKGREHTMIGRAFDAIQPIFSPLIVAICISIGQALSSELLGDDQRIIISGYELAIAWGVLRLVKLSTDSKEIIWFVRIVALTLLAISFSGNFELFIEYLNRFSFSLGSYEFSIVGIIKGTVALGLLLWIAKLATSGVRFFINRFTKLRVSNRELATKTAYATIYFVLFMVSLDVIGIDLTALAVLGGAIGVGLGFGLQKIASNLVSGLILLLEQTIEVNDVVELENGIYGYVRHIGARHTRVETLDTSEVLIPNEELITTKVTNWTFTNQTGRITIGLRVHYSADIHETKRVILEAVKSLPRIVRTPEPECLLDEFGESSIHFCIRVWIDDVSYRYWQVKSDVMFVVWDALKAANIEIAHPQMDMHIKSIDQSIVDSTYQPTPQLGEKK